MAALIWQALQPKSVRAGNACLNEGRVIGVPQKVNHQLLGGILDRFQKFFIGGGRDAASKQKRMVTSEFLARFTAC